MKTYNATFETSSEIVSSATFTASNMTEAKKMAQLHKRMTPEIRNAKGRVKVTVRKSN